MTITKFTRVYVRTYRDNGQTAAYVEWVDSRGRAGRTEGRICAREGDAPHQPAGSHMQSLFASAARAGVPIEYEVW